MRDSFYDMIYVVEKKFDGNHTRKVTFLSFIDAYITKILFLSFCLI